MAGPIGTLSQALAQTSRLMCFGSGCARNLTSGAESVIPCLTQRQLSKHEAILDKNCKYNQYLIAWIVTVDNLHLARTLVRWT